MAKTLKDVATAMRDIDFAMLSTHAGRGAIGARPMSNNKDVDYDGDSYYFAHDTARTIRDIERDRHVGLSFQSKSGLLGMKPFFIAIEGKAELIRDKEAFAEHWNKDLELWFADGIDTPDMVMIKVSADRIHYWDGGEEGEIKL